MTIDTFWKFCVGAMQGFKKELEDRKEAFKRENSDDDCKKFTRNGGSGGGSAEEELRQIFVTRSAALCAFAKQ